MDMGVNNKAELMLALLYAGMDNSQNQKSQPVEGITRLEKLLFLLKMEGGFLKNVSDEDDFHFYPFRMGPWTNEVYDEIDFLESLGLVTKKDDASKEANPADQAYVEELISNTILTKYQKTDFGMDKGTEVFSLTVEGKNKALNIWNRLSQEEKDNIVDLKRRFNTMNLKQFLRYVYQKYPQYATESEIKDALGIDW
ncbi:MAG: hypothetical protein QY309_03440 [Cyclobacteriaceae bacterium]|nr:MAG: hypothetical protein QY309_03440 [Cyclobacteriaceae bacterium]